LAATDPVQASVANRLQRYHVIVSGSARACILLLQVVEKEVLKPVEIKVDKIVEVKIEKGSRINPSAD
jgi:hypothetical protein